MRCAFLGKDGDPNLEPKRGRILCLLSPALAPYLEYHPEQGGVTHRILLSPLPFRIGRSKNAHWVIGSPRISKEHAEIVAIEGRFYVRDLGSTNGTFVNGQQVEECRLVDGDIVHFAHTEFLFSSGDSRVRGMATDPVTGALPASGIRSRRHLQELLARRCVEPVFQPIVTLPARETVGYEALGRGTHPELSRSPAELFRLAEQCQLTVELSRTFRGKAMEEVRRLPNHTLIFLNTHPAEIKGRDLPEELVRLQDQLGEGQQMVLEIHEHAVPDLVALANFHRKMHDRNILVAFDDFGAGQARLVELSETPPDFIKLDRSLIKDIDQAASRLEVVRSLCLIIRDLGIRIIAEGIETAEESQACQDLGCHFGQGYLFGRPGPAPNQKSS